ncbi:asparagine synthase [Emticicia sp. CRIBPO]|uniref:asparagine synthetase B family protein n=1 Tax=Emticicia sp. CRIBPO TaxID=2683258 RepID=UPI001412FC76|nr:asparagine synthase-related protein [Emticicia sp. CRIBPO]NBA84833.1 asparagine synthase [Emticicia sp. CRIBPO]
MSQFFGCIALRSDVDLDLISQKMASALAYFEPDQAGFYQTEKVFICNKLLFNTPESVNTPLICQNNRFVLAASVRLDNREELAAKLKLDENLSDHEYLLKTFETYKEKCVEHLLGDFSFVVWDKQSHELFMAKDHLGIRPLFYLKNQDMFLFSTGIPAIKAAFDQPLPLNREYIAYELKNFQPPVESTFFKDIFRLRPAHYLYFDPEKDLGRETLYWELSAADISHLKTDEERYAELRRLFSEAVKCRIRTIKNIGCQLSGGMDSSAITVLVSRIAGLEKLHTFSFVLNEKTRRFSEKGIDEQGTQKDMIEYAGLDMRNHHPVDDFFYKDAFEEKAHVNQVMGGHANSDCIWQTPLFKKSQEYKVGVILSGFPGDECVSNYGSFYFHDYIYQRNWKALFRFFREFKLRAIKNVLMYYLFKIIGTFSVDYFKIQKKRNLLKKDSPYHKTLKDSIFSSQPSFKHYLKAQVCRPHTTLRTESEGAYALQYGMETAYPLADIRLLQLVYSLPSEMFKPVPVSRIVFRTMCKDLLPDSVRLQPKHSGALTLAFAEYRMKRNLEDMRDYTIKDRFGMIIKEDLYQMNAREMMRKAGQRYSIDYMTELNS